MTRIYAAAQAWADYFLWHLCILGLLQLAAIIAGLPRLAYALFAGWMALCGLALVLIAFHRNTRS
ncbi:hypothetical protein [Roseomonas indoligenes]|uniref:Uncharacterized protein n=1 Tax=Roseomonas indoligenes TaxID=2820811 RepID=A0A940MUY7_9PROT|nr:hypothetical protein [Pararoseomonas indoligenes]MBP0492188.1 hypothetical protein [Pararoseomonas indoligenes]